MAITIADYVLWRKLLDDGVIPFQPYILELGEANWYGDVPFDTLREDIAKYVTSSDREIGELLTDQLDQLIEEKKEYWLFDVAKIFYETFTDSCGTDAIDLHGTPNAYRYDLNEPVPLIETHNGRVIPHRSYQVVVNTGTLEHLFDVAQGFRTMHDFCAADGLMVHTFPFRGWLDHGFWAMNPTLLVDLAGANGYEQLACCLYEPHENRLTWMDDPVACTHKLAKEDKLAAESTLHVAWRQTAEKPFVVPTQGYYAGSVSASVREDWGALR